ncbi:MAG: MerR family DNA-binding transcriptional regulator [Dehalococcoidia bacterium]|nr:MAG: MerR family DNA-binding transcriptional regulator [Dehalococcoidia bacterium]
MANQSFNINEAAKRLNVSTRTIRRYIKAGKLKAELVKGSFGDEYRILELPPQLDPNLTMDNGKTAGKTSGQPSSESFDLIRELQEKNLALAAQLGAAAERIRNLEGQVKLLAPPKPEKPVAEPWWQRLREVLQRRKKA